MSRDRIQQHPDEYREDLNPHYGEGQNDGPPWYETVPASEIKDLHELYPELGDDEMKRLPVLKPGSRLEQGATYLDLRHPQAGEFTAMGDQYAGPQHWLVPKSECDYELWNRIRNGEVGQVRNTRPDAEYRGGLG